MDQRFAHSLDLSWQAGSLAPHWDTIGFILACDVRKFDFDVLSDDGLHVNDARCS
jgi:hypothetical protein